MDAFHRELVERLNNRIERHGFCVLFDNDLRKLSPSPTGVPAKLIREIKAFAGRHGFRVHVKATGLNATFRKAMVRPGYPARSLLAWEKPRIEST